VSEPRMSCRICGRSITVVPGGRGFPPDIAKRKLVKDCKSNGCPCSPEYRAGISPELEKFLEDTR
jgi:hypothetical protein